MTEEEEAALVEAGADPLIWRLAMDEKLPFSGIADVLNAPAPILFQAEVLSDAFARVDRRAKIEQAINKAMRGRRGHNRG